MSYRIFFVDSGDNVKRVAVARLNRMLERRDRADSLPVYAGKRVRVAVVLIEVEGRRPVAIKDVSCGVLTFDREGLLDTQSWGEQMRLTANVMSPLAALMPPQRSSGQVIDAQQRFDERRYDHEYKWRPSPEVMKAIEAEIFREKKRRLRLV